MHRVRNAELTDLPRIRRIYAYARKFMAENGSWLSDSEYGTIHQLAGDGSIHVADGIPRIAYEIL